MERTNSSAIPRKPIIDKQVLLEKYGLDVNPIELKPKRCMFIRPLPTSTEKINDAEVLFPKGAMKNIFKYLTIHEILDLRFVNKYFSKLCIDIIRQHPQWLITEFSFLSVQTLKIIIYLQPQTLNLSNNPKINPEYIEYITSYCPRVKCLILERSDISFINQLDFYILNRLNLEKVLMPWSKASCDTIGKFFSYDVSKYMVYLKHIDIRGHKLSPNLLAFIIKVFIRLQFLDISECSFDPKLLFKLLKLATKRRYILTIKVSQKLEENPEILEKNIKFSTT
ncbi:hypothetical protein RF11_03609 [Thelohanellus kitauei]|uniref:F-box domain-containing protein n=1 Tax=Thelohanellus kitauei TaxID=669202 RepID=A0A0C2J5S2_THEKT|nr:hypothetical protein RF11_03609 [Thelohanellus kitauei]